MGFECPQIHPDDLGQGTKFGAHAPQPAAHDGEPAEEPVDHRPEEDPDKAIDEMLETLGGAMGARAADKLAKKPAGKLALKRPASLFKKPAAAPMMVVAGLFIVLAAFARRAT